MRIHQTVCIGTELWQARESSLNYSRVQPLLSTCWPERLSPLSDICHLVSRQLSMHLRPWHTAVLVMLASSLECKPVQPCCCFDDVPATGYWFVTFAQHCHIIAAGLQCSSFVPEGYTYVRHIFQTGNTASVQQALSSAGTVTTPFRSTGYVAHLDIAHLKSNRGHQQSSLDKDHDTLLTTREGQVYTRP